MREETILKYEKLKNIIKEMNSVVIAFSGGVDSTLLLKVARDILGENVIALIANSPSFPKEEFEEAVKIANILGVKSVIVKSLEFENPKYTSNPVDRCYFCKDELFKLCIREAKKLNFDFVIEGSNVEDIKDYRPGFHALKENNVRSPLMEANLTKEEIREISNFLNLPTWNKPSSACLASRFPYGTEITLERIEIIARCEAFLKKLGFKQLRVRYHNEIARIEVSLEDFSKFLDNNLKENIVNFFKQNGFIYVTVDLQGYRTGSLNELILKKGANT